MIPIDPVDIAALRSLRQHPIFPGGIYPAPTNVQSKSVQGRLIIPGQPFSLPQQIFVFSYIRDRTRNQVILENKPTNSWPKIRIEFLLNKTKGGFTLDLADKNVDGWLLYTRVGFLLAKADKFAIQLTGLQDNLSCPVKLNLDKTFLKLANICRKLKFIENVFNIKFSLPNEALSSKDLSNLEIVFRGITEGEFSVRAARCTFASIPPSDIDLTTSSFEGYGSFSRTIGDQITLFGQHLPVGPVTVHLERAELGGLKAVQHIQKGLKEPVDIRFEVLDNQIVYRFESFAKKSRKHIRKELKRFKQELARSEPKELVDLIDESLQKDVSSEEANQIAMGWTQYNDLPDRYCPQEPEIDSVTGHWRVPVWLVYTSGEGGPVGEIIIDKKTGIVISQTPIEEMHSRASYLINEYDEEVLTTARKFMDRHDRLLRRLAE